MEGGALAIGLAVSRRRVGAAIGLTLGALCASSCSSVPFDAPKTTSYAIADARDTTLGRLVEDWEESHPGDSGFYPLVDGLPAFGARLRMIEIAERSIDAQYFLIKPDVSGELFARALLRAADRGVRVRLLLDDVFTTARDDQLEAIDRHPNVEVRLFNPLRRGTPYLDFVTDFRRANRRMHNKSFTADNEVSIVGGRNIADEYFQVGTDVEFLDFDMLAFGPVAPEISDAFDRFWNSALAVPLAAIREADTAAGDADLLSDDARAAYERAMTDTVIDGLMQGERAAYVAPVEVITDEPEKLEAEISPKHQVVAQRLGQELERAESDVFVLTPYFIPRREGIARWEQVARRGVRVVVLTNSLATTNHVPVHAGYARYREDLLRAGVELYELRQEPGGAENLAGSDIPDSLTLHTKALLIDRSRIFAGSLNLDPRSIDINAEMGILIESPEMTGRLSDQVLAALPRYAWRLALDDDGQLEWHGGGEDVDVVLTREPDTSLGRRILAWLSGVLPESQL